MREIVRLNRIAEVVKATEKAAEKFAGDRARAIATRAAEIAPRLTGTLAGDFVVQGEGMKREVTNTAPYFIHVETGTHTTPAQPSLGPAARMAEVTFKSDADREIGREIK